MNRYLKTTVLLFLGGQLLMAQSKTARLYRIMKTYHQYNMFDGSVLMAENRI